MIARRKSQRSSALSNQAGVAWLRLVRCGVVRQVRQVGRGVEEFGEVWCGKAGGARHVVARYGLARCGLVQ